MGKPKKRVKKYQYERNRKKEWKKSKKMPTIECKQIKEAWDEHKSVQANMRNMGLAANANKALPLPKAKDLLTKGIEEVQLYTIEDGVKVKSKAVEEMELEANRPQPRRVRLSQPEVRYCIYMMEKYGEDYKVMARDKKNHYQETPKQIKRKINTFKSIPEQYNDYLKSKQTESMDDVT